MTPEKPLHVFRLGRVEYEDGLELQKTVAPDSLLLLEHPPVLTLGRGAKAQHVLASPEALERMEMGVFPTDRGGDVTYHGPGQIVGYPLIQLEGKERDVRRYVGHLEEAMIRACADSGLATGRIPQWTGVWVGEGPSARKVGAIGVHLSRWRTTHGFALNVAVNLAHFDLIVPCGITAAGVTSLEKELARPVPRERVESSLVAALGELLGRTPVEESPAAETVSIVVTRGEEVLLLKRTGARGGFWQPLTGRVEGGETPLGAASRELEEETGARADPRSLDYVHAFGWSGQGAGETAFGAAWPGGDVRIDPDEHDAFEWVDPADALARVPYAGLKEAIRRAVRPTAPSTRGPLPRPAVAS